VDEQLFAHEVLAVVLRVRDRRLDCLLWQRAKAPFDGQWSLPRGPLGATERLGTSASRHLAAKVDITSIAHMEQLETRSDPGRDPRGRVLATAYLALVATDVSPRTPADTAWHPVDALPQTHLWRGSANQRLVPLSARGRERYREHVDAPADRLGKRMQMAVDGNRVWYIGIPSRGDMPALEKACAERGVTFGDVSWRQ